MPVWHVTFQVERTGRLPARCPTVAPAFEHEPLPPTTTSVALHDAIAVSVPLVTVTVRIVGKGSLGPGGP